MSRQIRQQATLCNFAAVFAKIKRRKIPNSCVAETIEFALVMSYRWCIYLVYLFHGRGRPFRINPDKSPYCKVFVKLLLLMGWLSPRWWCKTLVPLNYRNFAQSKYER